MKQHDGLDPDWQQITRYLSGCASKEERQCLLDWVQASPDHQQLLEKAVRVWKAAEEPTDGIVDDHLLKNDWGKLRTRLRSSR